MFSLIPDEPPAATAPGGTNTKTNQRLPPAFILSPDKVSRTSLTTRLHPPVLTVCISSQTSETAPLVPQTEQVEIMSVSAGKTLSYAAPVVQSLQSLQPKVRRSDGPLAVVIVPTREVRSD